MPKIRLIILGLALCLFITGAAWAQNGLRADLLVLADSPTPDFTTMEDLINDDADINAADANGETVLMKAARANNDIAVAELLIGWGANLDAVDNNGETALMKAAQYNFNPRMVELIGRLGAKVDLVDNTGETALMKACKYTQNEEVVLMVLLLGADPKITTMRKMALDFAKRNNALKGTETLKILQEMSK